MSESQALIPTAVAEEGYGSNPVSAAPKKNVKSSRFRVAAGVASACALLGVVAMVASGKTSFYSPALGADAARQVTFDQVLATQGTSFAAVKKARVEAIDLLSQMTVRPVVQTGGARAGLGASEYQKCVAKGSKPSGDYVVGDEQEWKQDLVFVENRQSFPAVTAYNDSKALLMGVGCEVPPPNIFTDTSLCTDAETANFCSSDCGMPYPENCELGAVDWGSCEPTVVGVCRDIATSRDTCMSIKDQVVDTVEKYDAIEVGALPCRTEPDAPFAKAAYAQMKYETAYLEWVDAMNDATEVCTIGHALYVHNLALFEAHYAVVVSTTTDLKKMCAEEGAFDGDIPEDDDGNTTNAFVSAHKFDMSEAIEDAEEGFYEPSKHHHMGRKLVWWNQLCEPTIDAMEALSRSLEVESPQLMCFAETCKGKKQEEDVAFDNLVKAHNKFAIVFQKYTENVEEYNALVTEKDTALAQTITAFESFHPVRETLAGVYNKDFNKFDRFDTGADKGLCGLSSCQAEQLCQVSLHNRFETFVDTETCTAIPFDDMVHVCHPPPAPAPPPPKPAYYGIPPLPGQGPKYPAPPPAILPGDELPVDDLAPKEVVRHNAGTDDWEEAESRAEQAKQLVQKLEDQLAEAIKAAALADQNVKDLEDQLAAAIAAAAQLTGSAAAEALRAIEILRKDLAAAKAAAWEAHQTVAMLREQLAAAQADLADWIEKAATAKQLVGALNNLAEAEAALEEAKNALAELKKEIAEAQAIVQAAIGAQKLVDDLKQQLEDALNADPVDHELVASLRKQLEEAKEDLKDALAAAEEAQKLLDTLTPQLAKLEAAVAAAEAAVITAQAIVNKIMQGDTVAETTDTAEEAERAWKNAVAAAEAAAAVVAEIEGKIADAEAAIKAYEDALALVEDLKARLEECMNNGDTECVADLEAQLADAEASLADLKIAADQAKSDLVVLHAQLEAAQQAYAEAQQAADDAKAIVDAINREQHENDLQNEDVHGVEALQAALEAAEYAQAEAQNKVNDLKQRIADALALIDAVDDAQALVDSITAQIEEAQAAIDAYNEQQQVVDDLKKQLEAALAADPVDEALVASLREQLAEAEENLDSLEDAYNAAQEALPGLQNQLTDAVEALTIATEKAQEALAIIDDLKAELVLAEAALDEANAAVDAAKDALETAQIIKQAHDAHADALALVEDLTKQLEDALAADPVDEELIARLTQQLADAQEALAEAEITLKSVTSGEDGKDDMETAASEFESAREADSSSQYVEQDLIFTGYSTATFTEEMQNIVKRVVADVLQPLSAGVTQDDVVLSDIVSYAGAAAALGQEEDAAEADAVPEIMFALRVYIDAHPDDVKAYLDDISWDDFTKILQDAGMDDLVAVEAAGSATVVSGVDTSEFTDDDVILNAEEQEAAAEFEKLRDAMYANETKPDMVSTPEVYSKKSAHDAAKDASTPEEVNHVAAMAEKAVEEAEQAVQDAKDSLAAAEAALEECMAEPEANCEDLQAAVEDAKKALEEAEADLAHAQDILDASQKWAELTQEHADPVALVADLKNQIAIAQAAAAKCDADPDADKEACAAAKLLLIELYGRLEEAEAKVTELAEEMADAKATVIDMHLRDVSDVDPDDELAKAMEAWELAAKELADAQAFVDELKRLLEEAHRSGDLETIKSLEAQLTAALQALADAKVKAANAKALVDELTNGISAKQRAEEIAAAEAVLADAKAALQDAKALVTDLEAKLAAARKAVPIDEALIAQLEAQLEAAKAAVIAAEDAVAEAEQTLLDIETSHKRDIALQNARQDVPDSFDQELHDQKMAEFDRLIDDAQAAIDAAQKVVDDIRAQMEALALQAAECSDPEACKAAQEALKALQRKLDAALANLAAAVDHHSELVEARDAWEAKSLEHKNNQQSAADISAEIARMIAAEAAALSPGSAPGYAPSMAPDSMSSHYVKIVDADGNVRYVALDQLVAEAQALVDKLKSELLSLLDQMRAAAESGDAALYARLKAQVAALKAKLAEAEANLRDAYALVAKHGYGPAAAPGMAPGMAPGPGYSDKFIKVTVDGETSYVSANAAAEEARDAYYAALDKVEELKNDLLSLLAQMRAAAEAGDEELYNKLKALVEACKAKLRLAELAAQDALAAYNKAAELAPGMFAIAPAPSAHDSILLSDVQQAKDSLAALKALLLELIQKMQRAADAGNKVAYDLLKKQVAELKVKIALAERALQDAQDRLNGTRHAIHITEELTEGVVESPKAPPAPRYEGPLAVVSVDARHINWYPSPKGGVVGEITSESKGVHVEHGEIENVEKYDVVETDGLKLGHGDIKLPAMRDMADEAISVAIRLKFTHEPEDGACLFHMGNGDGDALQVKVEDGVLTFQASPSLAAGGNEKMAIIAMEEDVSSFQLEREYTIVAVLGNDGYMYLFVDGDKVAEGNGMVNELNGFIRDVTMGPRRDNYVGTCYLEETVPLSAGIIAVDVFDGEMSDLDVSMVSGSFTADEDFTTEPEIEV